MSRINTINTSIRTKILERDNYRCMKCGRTTRLEIHHIIPVVYGGKDDLFNLITLCSGCHKYAPDDPIKFIKFCSLHIPPDLERSKALTKTFLMMILTKDKNKILKSTTEEIFKYIEDKTEELYNDLWKVYLSNDINMFSIFMEKNISFKNFSTKEKIIQNEDSNNP